MKQKVKYWVVKVPITEEMGPYEGRATETAMESAAENALWHYNSSRAHDGLPPLTRMPKGTTFTPVFE